MYMFGLTNKERIIEFLIANQSRIKEEVEGLRKVKNMFINKEHTIFRMDLEEQYEARIRQLISFLVSDALALPAEYVIIEIENMKLEEYLDV